MVTVLYWPLLLVVADLAYVGDETRWLELIREVSSASVNTPVAIQVRAKTLEGDAWRAAVARAREAIPAGVPAFLNGDEATASALGYEAVHWPEVRVPARASKLTRWRSAAVHGEPALRAAERADVDYAVFGSVFEPGSKPGAGAGLDALRAICAASSVPVVAIGGITPERTADCVSAGARGVAVVSDVLGATSPGAAIEAYVSALGSVPAPAGKGGMR
ncbi:MAG: thiamine phosphate synthase [Chloroflexi bacterium]|nr:MAG: thiamine phosphate synthase [Chloroflexota bacterium]